MSARLSSVFRLFRTLLPSLLLLLVSIASAQLQTDAPRGGMRFINVDLMLDPRGAELAAYQVEFIADPQRVTLVGIEGGQHAAFAQPPYYDPKALTGNRVILAALNAGNNLPHERTRIARLHLQIKGDARPNLSAKLIVAASANEKAIPAEVSVLEGAVQ